MQFKFKSIYDNFPFTGYNRNFDLIGYYSLPKDKYEELEEYIANHEKFNIQYSYKEFLIQIEDIILSDSVMKDKQLIKVSIYNTEGETISMEIYEIALK